MIRIDTSEIPGCSVIKACGCGLTPDAMLDDNHRDAQVVCKCGRKGPVMSRDNNPSLAVKLAVIRWNFADLLALDAVLQQVPS